MAAIRERALSLYENVAFIIIFFFTDILQINLENNVLKETKKNLFWRPHTEYHIMIFLT